MLHPSVLLLLFLQISAVFCRTTADYKDETQAIENAAVSFSETSEDAKGSDLHHEMHNESAAGQGTMAYDYNWSPDPFVIYERRVVNTQLAVFAYVAIAFAIFTFISFVLGCTLFFFCRRKTTRGLILNTNRLPQQAAEAQQQPRPAFTQNLPTSQAGNLQVTLPKGQVAIAHAPPVSQKPQAFPPHYNQPTEQQQPQKKQPLYPSVQPVQQHSPESKQNQENPSVVEFHNPSVVEFHNPVASPPSYVEDEAEL